MFGDTAQYGFKGVEALRWGDLIERQGEVIRMVTGPYVKPGDPTMLCFGAYSKTQGVIGVTLPVGGTVPLHYEVALWRAVEGIGS